MSFTTNKPTIEGIPQAAMAGQAGRPGDGASAINLQVTRSLRMRPALAIGVAVAMLVAVIGYALLQKAQYSALSQLYEMPTGVKLLATGTGGNLDEGQYQTFLSEQMLLVTRPDVLKTALGSLSQDNWAEFGATEQAAAGNLTTLLKVTRVGTSHQVSIGLTGSDPVKTAAVVNAITTAYIDAARKATTAESDERAQLLAEERQRIEGELQADRAEQIALGASIGVANPSVDGGNPYDAALSGLRVQLSEARASHEVAAAQLASLSGLGPGGASGLMAAADEQILGDAGLGSMKASISQRKANLTAQLAGMTPTNPVYKQSQDEIADLDRTLDKMTVDLRDKAARRLQDKLHSDLQRTGDVESRLNSQLARQIASATSAAPRLQRATEVEANIQRLGVQLATVDEALRNLRLEVSGPAQVRLSLPATPPEHPEANRRKQLLMLAVPLAILFGIGATVLARMRDKRIFMGLDVVNVLGFQPLALLPARGEVSQRVFEEYLLRLAAGIESAYRTSGARTFLLTAVSLTTDIRPLASALTRKFEEIGVNVVVATASEMLTPMEGAGAEITHVVELGSEGFVAVNVAKLKAEHGLVLIESEALLNCAQTEYVARCADATILVIECSVTTREELTEATDLLHRLNVTGIAAVLQEVQLRYADAAFRNGIEVLDRRQAESRQPERIASVPLPVPVIEPVAEPVAEPVDAEVGQEPVATAVMQEPVAVAEVQEPMAAEVVQEPVAAAVVQEPVPVEVVVAPLPHVEVPEPVPAATLMGKLLETEGDRVQLDYEPSHYHEVLHHFRETRPFEHDSGWDLPAFGQVSAEPVAAVQEVAVPTKALWEESGAFEAVPHEAVAEVPQMVENRSHTGLSAVENRVSVAAISGVGRSLREKIAPKLSARRVAQAADGDARMTRKSSWFDKLLRRDSDPAVSIIPTDDEDDEDVRVNAPMSLPAARTVDLNQAVARTGTGAEEYDLPLASRLDQISRQRPAASGSHFGLGAGGARPVPRLQIVPPEPIEAEIEEELPVVEEPVVEMVHAAPALEPVAVEPVAVEPTAAVVDVAATEAIHPVAPASAEELPIEQPVVAAADIVSVLPEAEVVTAPEVVEIPVDAPADLPKMRAPRRPLSFHELAGVTEQREAVPAEVAPVEAVTVAPEAEAIQLPPVEVAHVPVEAAVVEEHQTVSELSDFSHTAAEPERVQDVVHEPTVVVNEGLHKLLARAAQQPTVTADVSETAPARASAFEADDIEPAYQEASRNLNNSRWDPIPTLRPSGIWRDRPSPVPVNGTAADRHYATGAVQDGFNSNPPRRWIPEEEPVVAEEPEPLPEPMLSRQWGLLSRFQQARLVSSSHRAADGEGSGDERRDGGYGQDDPGSGHGPGHGSSR